MVKQINLTVDEIDTIINALSVMYDKIHNPIFHKMIEKIKRQYHKKPIKVSSRKAKGRNLQKWAVEKIAELLNYELPKNKDESHIRSREMGQSGVDVVLSKKAKLRFPFAVECKNQEHINLPVFFEQARANSGEDINPLLIVKNKKLKEPLIIIEWDSFDYLFSGALSPYANIRTRVELD